jgi:crotonobetainyl-CoA:carnitine CoA-transferase CaiB-like acyl-CoA transferase
MIREIEDPQYGRVKIPNSAFRFSETASGPKGHIPRLGEHNREVLNSLMGYSDNEISQLQSEGVIYSDLKGYSLQEILDMEKQKEHDPQNKG